MPPSPRKPVNLEPDELDGDFDAINHKKDVTSSIWRHEFENGRRFHRFRSGRYPLPNDDEEQSRDLIKHRLHLIMTDGELTHAPISAHPQRIIDLGTGTGEWAIAMADQYPSAQVIGVDLSPIMPQWHPPNLDLIVDDIESEWIHGDGFDLVHMRHVVPTLRDTREVLRSSFQFLKPGGWMEIQEFGGEILCDDGTMPANFAPKRFLDLCEVAMGNFGCDFRLSGKLKPLLDEAGFRNIQCSRIKTPIGPWSGTKKLRVAGAYMQAALSKLFSALAAKPLQTLGLDPTKLEGLIDDACAGLEDKSKHMYIVFYIWIAQKPLH